MEHVELFVVALIDFYQLSTAAYMEFMKGAYESYPFVLTSIVMVIFIAVIAVCTAIMMAWAYLPNMSLKTRGFWFVVSTVLLYFLTIPISTSLELKEYIHAYEKTQSMLTYFAKQDADPDSDRNQLRQTLPAQLEEIKGKANILARSNNADIYELYVMARDLQNMVNRVSYSFFTFDESGVSKNDVRETFDFIMNGMLNVAESNEISDSHLSLMYRASYDDCKNWDAFAKAFPEHQGLYFKINPIGAMQIDI